MLQKQGSRHEALLQRLVVFHLLCVSSAAVEVYSPHRGHCRVHGALLVSSSLHRARGTQISVPGTSACP